MMRISEIYPSVQGEGPNVGAPTTFVRFGGCNLRCPGWPCDTPHAIFADQFRKEWKKYSVEDIITEVGMHTPRHVCLTGGEPMLQPSPDIVNLVEGLTADGRVVEMFSNGTLEYPTEILDDCSIVLDWKLPGSGEWRVGDSVRMDNFRTIVRNGWGHSIKFTIADQTDFDKAVEIYRTYMLKHAYRLNIYAGVVWGKEMTNQQLVDLLLKHDLFEWKLNVQVHNHIWDRTQRGI